MSHWIKVGLYLVAFIFSFYGLSGLDFGKILRKGQTAKAYVLLVLCSLALAYLVSNFLLVISGIIE